MLASKKRQIENINPAPDIVDDTGLSLLQKRSSSW